MVARLRGALGKLSVDSMQKSYPVVGVTLSRRLIQTLLLDVLDMRYLGSEVVLRLIINYRIA